MAHPYYTHAAAPLMKRYMQQHHYSQTQLAKKLGISQATLIALLDQELFLTDKLANKIAQRTGIPKTSLLADESQLKTD